MMKCTPTCSARCDESPCPAAGSSRQRYKQHQHDGDELESHRERVTARRHSTHALRRRGERPEHPRPLHRVHVHPRPVRTGRPTLASAVPLSKPVRLPSPLLAPLLIVTPAVDQRRHRRQAVRQSLAQHPHAHVGVGTRDSLHVVVRVRPSVELVARPGLDLGQAEGHDAAVGRDLPVPGLVVVLLPSRGQRVVRAEPFHVRLPEAVVLGILKRVFVLRHPRVCAAPVLAVVERRHRVIVLAGEALAPRRFALELGDAVWVVRDEPAAPHRRVHRGEAVQDDGFFLFRTLRVGDASREIVVAAHDARGVGVAATPLTAALCAHLLGHLAFGLEATPGRGVHRERRADASRGVGREVPVLHRRGADAPGGHGDRIGGGGAHRRDAGRGHRRCHRDGCEE